MFMHTDSSKRLAQAIATFYAYGPLWQDGAMLMKKILSVTAEKLRRWTTSCSAAGRVAQIKTWPLLRNGHCSNRAIEELYLI